MNGLLGASTSSHLCLARACGPRTRRGPTGSQCRLTLRTRAQAEPKVDSEGSGSGGTEEIQSKPTKDSISKTAKNVAATFAPRASGSTGKNPAVKGSLLYDIFAWQGWIAAVAGGLLSFNILFPSDHPDIARLMGMWSIWMLTVPSWRARECAPEEKSALDILFLALPLLNITLPLIWKSFPFVWTADMVALLAVYYWKNAQRYLIP